MLIIKGDTKINYELIVPGFSKDTGESPCKDIGIGAPKLSQNLFSVGYSEDSVPSYGLVPGFEGIYDGTWICLLPTKVRINSHGFRDYEYPLEKPSNTFRIIILGDSHTFGLGVELNDTYPKVLESLLNKGADGLKYEVINLGVPGYNMLEKVEFFKKNGLLFNPDIVMVQADLLMDDAMNRTEQKEFINRYTEDYLVKHGLNKSKISEWNLTLINSEAYEIYTKEMVKKPLPKVLSRIKEPLFELKSITGERYIPVVHLYLFNINSDERSIWMEIDKDFGFYMFNFKFYKGSNHLDLILHPKDPHPNAFAHKLIAEEIHEKLIENKLLPMPEST